jgi:hypothetical protein
MHITLAELRRIIRESIVLRRKKLIEAGRKEFDYRNLPGVGHRTSYERTQDLDLGQATGFEVARLIGSRQSPTGTKRASLSAAKIQHWISDGMRRRPDVSGIWGKYDDRNGIVPFKGVDWTLGLLFSEGARYVGSQSGIDTSAGFEYNITDPTGRKSSPYSGYVYYINSREFIQIDNISVAQRAEIFNKFRNATPEEKQYYIGVFKGEVAPRDSTATASAAPAEQPPAAVTQVSATPVSAAQKFDAAKAKVKSFVRQPKDYAFWAGIFGRESTAAAKGKEGQDSTFVKQVLGKEYMKEWKPDEMSQLARELMALSKK